MEIVKNFKFITWHEFGEFVEENRDVEPSISIGQYANRKRYDVGKRLSSATKELLTFAKIYNIPYDNSSSPVKFSWGIIDAIFTTIIVSAEERDMILKAQSEAASPLDIQKAEEVISELMLPNLA